MPRFLGLKSYLTTNRSNIVKREAIDARHSSSTKRELLREKIADKLKCPMCFCVPCVVVAITLVIVTVLYVTIPYKKGLKFQATICTVQKIEFLKKGSCSLETEKFQPCYKIIVVYNTTDQYKRGVLMENEQTMFHCDKCSYTFGKGELYQKNCPSDSRSCVIQYHEKYGQINSKYSCYYDPSNPEDVFREFKTTSLKAIYQTSVPALLILLFTLGFVFLRYDDNQRRKMNKRLKMRNHRQTVGTHRQHPQMSPDSKSLSSLISDAPSSLGSTTAMYRVRKKKMPCTKSHMFSTRDEEDVILEEKPISPSPKKQSDVFMQVNMDKSEPRCSCASPQSLSSGFELARVKEHFRPVIPSQRYYNSRSKKALRYLPETVV